MSRPKLSKYYVETMDSGSILNIFKIKPVTDWLTEHAQRVMVGALLMEEMGIGKRIYEFHDANFVNETRVKTFSDALSLNHETTIVSMDLQTGNTDGTNTMNTKKGPYGGLFEYVTEIDIKQANKKTSLAKDDRLSYAVIDSIIFDYVHPRLKNYLMTAVALGKDCYLPLTGYHDSKYIKKGVSFQETLISQISNTPGINIESFETTIKENNGFVKVLKINKG